MSLKHCIVLGALMAGCAPSHAPAPKGTTQAHGETGMHPTFERDLTFLREHTDIVLLEAPDGKAQVAVAPAYQGRVMTSTADGPSGRSFGYVHRAGVEAGMRTPHMTVLGGEDRFWLGPEGGQYALYFEPGTPFDFEHWQVPEAIDWGAWPIVSQSSVAVSFRKEMTLKNYAGTWLSMRVDRTVRIIDAAPALQALGAELGASLHVVAYESDNVITNIGKAAWTKEQGLPSIWILGMFQPAPRATVVLPFVPGPEESQGPVVNDRYFGAIDPSRLQVRESNILFRADGQSRGKIGIAQARARDVAGSYDPDAGALTLVWFTLPKVATDYVSSMWEVQKEPFAGDVVNSYNDGPPTPGAPPMGPFYEIESSSPAAALAPGESLRHVHRTLHVTGAESDLDRIARSILKISLADIQTALQ